MESLRGNHSYVERVRPPVAAYAENVAAYLHGPEAGAVLRPDQKSVFEDLHTFFADGDTRGYVDLPTGSGKTVLFVKLAKALLSGTPESRPRILVVTPTKDLVYQTIGRTGEQGFGRFAPEIAVGSYFSDTAQRERERLEEWEVVVTTYRSFRTLCEGFRLVPVEENQQGMLELYAEMKGMYGKQLAKLMSPGHIKKTQTRERQINIFDAIIFDEGHHLNSQANQNIVSNLDPNQVILAFTASPDRDKTKRLQRILPRLIHELGLAEAIDNELLTTITGIGVPTGIEVRGSNLYDENGDFIDSRIHYLAEDPRRNDLIVRAAQILVKNGIPSVIPCIAGDGAWHAKHIASLLQSKGVRTEAVHSEIAATERARMYRRYNAGDIDALTYIGVLNEGWDSPRTKGLVNGRPTRAQVLSKQRVGRVTRPGSPAFTIDICDDYGDNPSITVADVLRRGSIKLGQTIGPVDDADPTIARIIAAISKELPVLDTLEDTFTQRMAYLDGMEKLYQGKIPKVQRGDREYAVLSSRGSHPGITEEILARLEEMTGITIPFKLGVQGVTVRKAFDVNAVGDMRRRIPVMDPNRYHVDAQNKKWLVANGLAHLFSKLYPQVTKSIVEKVLKETAGDLEWTPVKYESSLPRASSRVFTVTKAYSYDQTTIDVLKDALKEYFSNNSSNGS